MDDASPQPDHTVRLLYIGRRITTRNRLAHFYLRADDGQQWGGTAKPLVAEHRPGAVIELTLNQAGDGRFVTGEHQPVLAWQLADRAAYTDDRARNRNRSAARDQPDPLLEHLARCARPCDGCPHRDARPRSPTC